jgi:outer membrane scaffolding protein for murein synthesis (MipA/OmpV family)
LRGAIAKKYYSSFFLIIFLIVSNAESSEDSSKEFEWGAGLLSLIGNHYRGSNQSKNWNFPVPYFSYKSDKLEAEPSYVRGIFYKNDYFSFKISLMLGLNVESEENTAREGMPQLDYTIEAGPMLIFYLWKSDDNKFRVNFEVPIRESFATNLRYLKPIGLIAIPYLNFIHNPKPSKWNWNSEFSISPMFASKSYHQYFYSIDKQYSTIERPEFEAQGGYSGIQATINLNKRIGNVAIIPVIRWDILNNAVFEKSPLVKTRRYVIFGMGLFWIIN